MFSSFDTVLDAQVTLLFQSLPGISRLNAMVGEGAGQRDALFKRKASSSKLIQNELIDD